jgi:hypothetical protein
MPAFERSRQQVSRNASSLAVFVVGLLLMSGLHVYYRPFAHEGTYFQKHSSEDMMQTVSLVDLREHPGETLLVLHIQPPLLDALRGMLAQLWPGLDSTALLVQVDRSLYVLWALVYASIGALVHHWLRRLGSGRWLAMLAALGFLLHPAAIYYATFLEGTLLTSFGILSLCYALWRVPARGATVLLIAAYLLLFLVRSIFQWPALCVVVAALLLRQAPRRSVLVFALSSVVVVGAFMLKQYLVFGSTSTSSFAGWNCMEAIGEVADMSSTPNINTPLGPLYRRVSADGHPPALIRETKLTGAHNFNHLAELRNNRELLDRCLERAVSDPLGKTLRARAEHVSTFFQPSSRYLTTHVIVDRLPWRPAFDWVFSGIRLVLLLVLGCLLWVRGRTRSEILGGLGLALPVLFVFAACVVFGGEESMRFKFFVEPVLYVFLVAQGAALARMRRPSEGSARATAADP